MKIPLTVDLDGTLIRSDTMSQSFLALIKKKPLLAFIALAKLCQGKSYFKRYLADSITLDPSKLPYNQEFLEWLKQEKATGRELILISATEQRIADNVANYLQIFDHCYGSHGKTNLKSENKTVLLDKLYGKGNYAYAGNHHADYVVWQSAKEAIVVNAPQHIINKAKRIANVVRVFS